MIIESCRIENMGKLSNVNLNFKEGLSVIKEDNGWGKSTLSIFIKSMFYGLDGDGRRNDLIKERKRYNPWQGGTYGGSIVFSTHGRRYEIIRIFGTKASEDIFELRDADTGLVSTDYTENIGEELFHINSESFAKTVFIKQNDCASSDTTDDINSRIGRIDDGMDLNRYKAADAQLEKTINILADKKNGKQGRLNVEINELRSRCDSGRDIEKNISEIEKRIESRKNEISGLNNRINAVNLEKEAYLRKLALLNDRQVYEDLLKEFESKKSDSDEKRSFFPSDVPTDVTVNGWQRSLRDIQNKQTEIESIGLTDDEKIFLKNNENLYSDEKSVSSEIAAVIEKIKKLLYLRKQDSAYYLSEEDTELLSFYREMFGTEIDPVNELRKLFEKNSIKKQKEETKLRLENEITSFSKLVASKKKAGFIAFGAMLMLGISAAGVSFVLNNMYLLIAGGIVSLLAALLFVIKPGTKRLVESINQNTLELTATEEEIVSIEDEINSFMDLRGLVSEDGNCDNILQSLLSDAYLYKSLKEKEEKRLLNDKSSECELLRSEIAEFMNKCGKPDSEETFMEHILEIRNEFTKYGEYRRKNEHVEKLVRELMEMKSALCADMSVYGFEQSENTYDQLERIEAHLSEYTESVSLFTDVLQRTKRFEDSHDMEQIKNLSGDCEIDSDSFELLLNKLNEEKEELLINNKDDIFNLDNERQRYLEWIEDCDKLAALKEELNEVIRKHNILVKTRELLQKARESMTAEYIVPLSKGFNKYYSMLTGESGEEYSLDADIVLTKYEKGMRRDKHSLSAGFQDLIGFCMRLSMADAMYKDEKPVLIMDDPFVNLDDRKFNAAKTLIEKVAENYQIIYMTCREDRL